MAKTKTYTFRCGYCGGKDHIRATARRTAEMLYDQQYGEFKAGVTVCFACKRDHDLFNGDR